MHGSATEDRPAANRLARALDGFARSPCGLAVLWALFLLPRVGVLLVDVVPTSDAAWYFGRAAELAAGLGYLDKGEPTAFWPPGWPLALSAVFRLTGPSVLAVGLFNLACAAATAWFTLALGRRLFASEAAARTGLLLLAVYPNSIGYVPLALTEVFYTALLMAGCWLFVTRKSAWMLIPVGAIFGFATLVKAQTLVVVPVLFAIEWLRAPDIWRRMPALVLQGALVLAVAALTVLPWTVRNHQQVGHWVAVSANGGFTLLTGNNDSATGDYTPDDPTVAALMARPGLDEVARDAEARRLAMAWIEVHPGKFLALMPQKLARLWLPDGEAEWAYQGGHPGYAAHAPLFRAIRYANQGYYGLLMLGFAVAFAAMVRQRVRAGARWIDWWLLPYGVAAYLCLVAVVFSGQSRFHYPVMPFVCLTVGWLIAEGWRKAGDNPPSDR
jgi:hypothetical protein